MSNQWQDTGTHIAIAVHSIQVAKIFYKENLGLTWVKEEIVQEQGVKVAFFKAGGIQVELLEPLNQNTTVAKFLRKHGEGIHHLALGTPDIQKVILNMTDKGVSFVSNVVSNGADDTKIAFIPPTESHGVLLEVCEKQTFKRETEENLL